MRDRDQAITVVGDKIADWTYSPQDYEVWTNDEKRQVAEEVIDAYEALPDPVYEAARAVLTAWDDFNNPKIRVGPVWPRMNDLRAALGEVDA